MMRPKTATALAMAGVLLSVPAARAEDPLRPALGGHETVAAQMRSEARDNRRDDLARRAFRSRAASPATTASASTPPPSGAACAA